MKKTARISINSPALVLAIAVLLSGCLSVRVNTGDPNVGATTEQQLVAAMEQSAGAWNRGDLNGFLAVYKDEARTAFMAPTITYGLTDIKARYARTYFKDGKPKAQLTYDDLKYRALGNDHVLMTGKWHLTDADGKKQDGYYSLIWERTSAGWKIIHDHSS